MDTNLETSGHPDKRVLKAAGAEWPALPFAEWKDTYATLHMWTQIVGKIRLSHSPWINHSWHVPLYVTSRGLTTSLITSKPLSFQIDFDFVDHSLIIDTVTGDRRVLPLAARSVADFFAEVTRALAEVGIETRINTMPCEVSDPIPFEQDRAHQSYDPEYANRLWRALVQAARILNQFRAAYIGKCSPVHFFWGSFDLAVTRFSGRRAPPHPGGVPYLPDWVAREAYSHEVSSCGFWPGSELLPYPAFYAYAYPEPAGYPMAKVPPHASYNQALHEFILPYDKVREAQAPDTLLLEFLQATYGAAADLGTWDRASLERPAGLP